MEQPQFSSTVLGSRGARRGASRGAVPRERQTSSAQGPAEGEIRGEEGNRDGEEFLCSSQRGGLPFLVSLHVLAKTLTDMVTIRENIIIL